jgi:prepilin-type N-terminal cleavage/methylation domain-containing protein
MIFKMKRGGYTLVELVIAVGLFSVVMLLATGAYLMMIGINQQTQGVATGINSLSFALETMTRNIRTGGSYSCGIALDLGDCSSGETSFSFKNENGATITYSLTSSAIQQRIETVVSTLTDPSSVTISSLKFYVTGTGTPPSDLKQARVTIVVSGTVSAGEAKPKKYFTIETGATMRGSDI